MSDKENLVDAVYGIQPQKRIKQTPRLTVLATSNHLNHDTNEYGPSFTYVPQNPWREMPPAHLSPYPHSGSEMAYGSDYSRSPMPEAERNFHPNHLAPILNHTHSHSHSPIDSPAFSHSGSLQPTDYFSRNGHSYMQQQQMEYLQVHGHPQAYDYGSPYLADAAWDGSYSQTTNA